MMMMMMMMMMILSAQVAANMFWLTVYTAEMFQNKPSIDTFNITLIKETICFISKHCHPSTEI